MQSQFKVGDKAVYASHGVGEVMGIENRDVAGEKHSFYVLKILENGMKVMIPTATAKTAGLREVITKKEAAEVMDVLKSDEIAVDSQPWNRRYREYMDMLKSGSPFQVAKVLRDLYRLKGDKDLSFGERRLLDTARSLLIKELALARRVKEAVVEGEISAIFGLAASA
jgi:CarD family transcriptional regulator, regulator of rRNA transcription